MEPPNGADYGGVPVITLETIRIRLSQLVHSLHALNSRVQSSDPSVWSVIYQQLNVVWLQLNALSVALYSAVDTLQLTAAFPLPSFPVKTHSWLLTTLLRKKNLPEVDAWVQKGIESSETMNLDQDEEFSAWVLKEHQNNPPANIERAPIKRDVQTKGIGLEELISWMSGSPEVPPTRMQR